MAVNVSRGRSVGRSVNRSVGRKSCTRIALVPVCLNGHRIENGVFSVVVLVRFLLDSIDPRAAELRRRFVFKV